jgi:hypothetical protein
MGDMEAKLSEPFKNSGDTPTLADNTAPGNSPARRLGRGQKPPFKKITPEKPKVVDHGDLDMRIARDGTWFYRGSPIYAVRRTAAIGSSPQSSAVGLPSRMFRSSPSRSTPKVRAAAAA